LVLTADDFGLAEEVNEAVELAHRKGVLSAASLMVAGPAARHAVRLARRMPRLRIGLHLVLVDGTPALPPAELAELVDAQGALRDDLIGVALRLVLRPRARQQIAREMAAQFAAFRETGLILDHVNAHRHFHVHPVIAALLFSLGRENRMKAIRAPLEPVEPLTHVEPTSLNWSQRLMDPWAKRLRERAHRAGLRTADATFGIRWSGQMTARRLSGLIRHLPGGLVEIYFHPATTDAFAGSAPGYRYTDELAALVDPEVTENVKRSPFSLGGYLDVPDTTYESG
jgi:hopanoid biosynthesis associated protein HpnK